MTVARAPRPYRRVCRFEGQLLVELFRAIRIALYAEAKS